MLWIEFPIGNAYFGHWWVIGSGTLYSLYGQCSNKFNLNCKLKSENNENKMFIAI